MPNESPTSPLVLLIKVLTVAVLSVTLFREVKDLKGKKHDRTRTVEPSRGS